MIYTPYNKCTTGPIKLYAGVSSLWIRVYGTLATPGATACLSVFFFFFFYFYYLFYLPLNIFIFISLYIFSAAKKLIYFIIVFFSTTELCPPCPWKDWPKRIQYNTCVTIKHSLTHSKSVWGIKTRILSRPQGQLCTTGISGRRDLKGY